ncbi:MAG: ADP-forming succinate--CoA ligase subunit beta [Nitrososphaerales archaeon]
MNLQEYEALRLFASAGAKVPKHILVKDVEGAAEAYKAIGGTVALKAQVAVAGRGKAGGIVKVSSEAEVRAQAEKLLKSEIKGLKVESLLVEEWINAEKELYLGFTIDRSAKKAVALACGVGGIDLEDLVKSKDFTLVREHIDPLKGLMRYQAYHLAKGIGLKGGAIIRFVDLSIKLYQLFKSLDCELLESNPLALCKDDSLIALDARIIVDDNALPRHSELAQSSLDLNPLEREARKEGFSYVDLEGDIGVIGNGAGLVMATLDTVTYYGGRPACFLDVGGGASSETVEKAVRLALRNQRVKVLLVNVLGGITRCDEVALGLVNALQANRTIPIVVRLVGVNEEAGRRLLREAGRGYYESMEEAAEAAVKALRGD